MVLEDFFTDFISEIFFCIEPRASEAEERDIAGHGEVAAAVGRAVARPMAEAVVAASNLFAVYVAYRKHQWPCARRCAMWLCTPPNA
jgi:hypothetical protein